MEGISKALTAPSLLADMQDPLQEKVRPTGYSGLHDRPSFYDNLLILQSISCYGHTMILSVNHAGLCPDD
jgi:hypothetical protein